jgi:predicted ATPase
MPETAENRRREQAVQTVYGPALVATRGYADASVERAYTRSLALCEPDNLSDLFLASLGLWMFHVVRANFGDALKHAGYMMELAESLGDNSLMVEACFAMGCTTFFMGDPEGAMCHCRMGVKHDSPSRERSITLRTNQDAGVCCLTYMAMCAYLLGHADEAAELTARAEALARQINHPFSIVYALHFRGWQNLWMRDYAAAKASSDEVIRMSEEAGFFWVTLGSCIRGRVMAEAGDIEGGLRVLRTGLDGYRAPGARLSQTLQLAFEAEIDLKAGAFDAGLERIGEAKAAMEATGERFWQPEILRLEGDLLLACDPQRAEACYRRALEAAQAQHAPAHVSRARASLEALLVSQGRLDEAKA